MKYILSLVLLVASFMTQASSLYIGGWSHHFGGNTDSDGYEYNSSHEMVAFEHENIFAGTMLNSYHTRSYLLGYQFNLIEEDYFNLDVAVGGVHGYTKEQNDIFRLGSINGFASVMLEANTPYVKPVVMLFGTAFVLSFKYEF